MPQIITWNKDDETETISQNVLAEGEQETMTVEEFEARWVGKHDTPPTLDENGQALEIDALYTDSNEDMHKWTGTEWQQVSSDGDGDVEITEPLRDVAIYCYPDDYTISVGTEKTTIANAEGELILTIDDVNSSNSHLYSVDDTPDTFYGHKWRYTEDDGWSDQLDTWVDPALFDEGS